MRVRIAASASEELVAAVRWYEDKRPGLGAAFFDTVQAAVARVEEHPNIGNPFDEDSGARRVLIPGFPYQVVYFVRPAEIVVVAVAHLSRRPGYWAGRD